MLSIRTCLIPALALLLALPAAASEFRLESLSIIDQQYMQTQRERVEELARTRLGQRLGGERDHDLAILQSILDRRLIEREDTAMLQALGIVLGNLLAAEHSLTWVIYTDSEGRSRALQIQGSNEVLFPVTMISRRYGVGGEVDVKGLYERASEIVTEIKSRQSFY